MDCQTGLAVHLFDVCRGDQLIHLALLPPAALPDHLVHAAQQGADVTLFTLRPVQNLMEGENMLAGAPGIYRRRDKPHR